ncbi:hypothetical protein NVP1029O_60 [Vibrio phage 1.029.O._10N.261.55.A7]|nr:hypothetical protein NVP1029O_60 [Vibrio phage 1.029.O._10N.261.55.A7]
MKQHIGKERSRLFIAKSTEFHDRYKTLKSLVNGLESHGEYNLEFNHVPNEWLNKLLDVLPPITRRGMFYQYWVIN